MMGMMATSISEVYEKMFYIFLEPSDVTDQLYDIETAISFSGSKSGTMKIHLSNALAVTMVQNMLNVSVEDVLEDEIEDCTKEAVNMICGNFLSKLDTEIQFDLSIPVFSKIGEGDGEKSPHSIRLQYAHEYGQPGMMVELAMD